jgi:hypothetical protein
MCCRPFALKRSLQVKLEVHGPSLPHFAPRGEKNYLKQATEELEVQARNLRRPQ